MKIALIGYGGIARKLTELLSRPGGPEIVGVLVRNPQQDTGQLNAVNSLQDLLALQPDAIVECAGQGAIRSYAEPIAASGTDLIVASVGALADADLLERVIRAARDAGSQIAIPAGALGAIDALAAARMGTLSQVQYRGTKPAKAWRGTPAENLVNLEQLQAPTEIFRGNARDAALKYPKNSNVAATVALAGLGFERTDVVLVADPTATRNTHGLTVTADAVEIELTLIGLPSIDNPKTSALTALSLARAVLNRDAVMVV